MTIATEARPQNHFFLFFFLCLKESPLTRGDEENSRRWGFLAFWSFESEWKFRKNVKMQQKNRNSAKSEYYPPRHIETYIRIIIIIQVTTQITDSPLLIPTATSSIVVNFILSKSNSSVHLFHDQSVTNVKTIFVLNTTKLQFYCKYNCEREIMCLQIIIINW